MENSKEHLRGILNEAIPTPHFNVINFGALRELLENTIELQTSNSSSSLNCPEESVVSQIETDESNKPNYNESSEQLNINAKKLKKPRKYFKKISPIVGLMAKRNKLNQAPKNNDESTQDIEVSLELEQEKSSGRRANQKPEKCITETVITIDTYKPAKKVLIGKPSIRIPDRRSKINGTEGSGTTESVKAEKLNSSKSSESNELTYKIDSLNENIKLEIRRSFTSEQSHTNDSVCKIDAKTLKSCSEVIKNTIKMPLIKIIDKCDQFKIIGTKYKHGNSVGQQTDTDEMPIRVVERSYDEVDQTSNIEIPTYSQ